MARLSVQSSGPPPSRFRAMAFGKAIGPWRARRVLAQQDLIDAGQASRDWESGLPYIGPGTHIAQRPGAAPITAAEARLAQALAFHRRHGSAALVRAATERASYPSESEEALLWAEIVEELRTIRAEALRTSRR